MAQFRQSGTERFSGRGGYQNGGAGSSDHVAIGIRNGSGGGIDSFDGDFLTNVTRIDPSKVLKFGQGSVVHGRDSRYWDKDNRRRDDDYNEEEVEHKSEVKSVDKDEVKKDASLHNPVKSSDLRGIGLYNEAGRNELKKFEVKYQASLGKGGQSLKRNDGHQEAVDVDPDDDETIDTHDSDEYIDSGHDDDENEELHREKPTEVLHSTTKKQNMDKDDETMSKTSLGDSSFITKGGKSGKASRSDTKRRGRRRSSGDYL